MHIHWTDLRPHWRLGVIALLLATASQVLALVDPIIFGTIIDKYTIHRAGKSDAELVSGVLKLLGIAVAVAIASRLAKAVPFSRRCKSSGTSSSPIAKLTPRSTISPR